MWNTILTVCRKELRDHLRDRRTATMIFLLSIAMGPLLLMGLANYIASMEVKAERREVFVDGREHAPTLVNYLLRQGMTLKEPKADYRELVKQGRHDAVLVVPKSFEAALRTGDAKLEIVYDDTRQDASSRSIGALRNAMRGFNGEIGAQRLLARGISPQLLRPVEVRDVNLGTTAQRAAGLLFIIPWLALFACVSGATAIAIDMTAGERERGSLEPLLMTPTSRTHLVIGKSLAVSIYALTIAFLTLLGFALTLSFAKLPAIGSYMSLSPAQYAGFALTMLSFAPAMGVLQMLIATYGRTYKEAQTYVTYLIMAISMVPVIQMMAQLKDATWQLLLPMLGQIMVITRLLRNEPVDWLHFALPAAVNTGIVVVAVWLVARLLSQEKIVFGRA